MTTSLRGMGNANSGNAPPASLCIVRTLVLPIFHPDYCVHMEYMLMDGYCPCQRDLEVLQQQQQWPAHHHSWHFIVHWKIWWLASPSSCAYAVRAQAGIKPPLRSATVRCLRSLTLALARAAWYHGMTKRMPMPEVEKKRTRAKSRRVCGCASGWGGEGGDCSIGRMGSSCSMHPAHLAIYIPLDNSACRTTLALSWPQTHNTWFQHCTCSRILCNLGWGRRSSPSYS